MSGAPAVLKFDAIQPIACDSYQEAVDLFQAIRRGAPLWSTRVTERGYGRWFVSLARPHAMSTERTLARVFA